MPANSISSPPTVATAPEPAPAAEPAGAGPFSAVRAFAVMLGGPIVLLAAVTAAAARTVRALRAGRMPCIGAVSVLGATAAYQRWARPWMRRWGATDVESERPLPGADTGAGARSGTTTNVVPINAPAEAVWPWVAQIGQDRGGFYSYTWLENLAGCRMRNADRVHPEWQQRTVGETVLLHPATGLKLLQVEPGHALVFEGGWSLAVEPDGPERCRLLARSPIPTGLAGRAYGLLLELPHFIMQRRMLLDVKRLAEAAA
jgi:hypothetical protein